MNRASKTSRRSTRKPLRVLVAEDSPLNQQVALKQLERLGYSADAVPDGAQAVEASSKAHFDLILMDCQMPVMNGYEATWQIREREKAQNTSKASRICIIAMTANSESDTREKCIAAGMDGFIHKPVQMADLEAAMLRALADRAAQSGADDVIDPVVILGLRQLRGKSKVDPLTELIDLFLQEAPAQLQIIEEAISKNDAVSLSRILGASVTLKGNAGNLGARSLAALCDELEHTATTMPLNELRPVAIRAAEELERVRKALEQIKAES